MSSRYSFALLIILLIVIGSFNNLVHAQQQGNTVLLPLILQEHQTDVVLNNSEESVFLYASGSQLYSFNPTSQATKLIGSSSHFDPSGINNSRPRTIGIAEIESWPIIKLTDGHSYLAGLRAPSTDGIIYVEGICDQEDCGSHINIWYVDAKSYDRNLIVPKEKETSDLLLTPVYWNEKNRVVLFEAFDLSKHLPFHSLWEYDLARDTFTQIELRIPAISSHIWVSSDNRYLLTTSSDGIGDRSTLTLIQINTDTYSTKRVNIQQSNQSVTPFGWISVSRLNLLLAMETEASGFTAVSDANTGFQYPMTNDHYGYQWLNWTGTEYHPGDDYNGPGSGNADCGTDIHAVADGTVRDINLGGWGTMVIEHNWQGITIYSQYGHLASVMVAIGQQVVKGEHIAEMGDQGTATCHLHWEIRKASHPSPTSSNYYDSSVLSNSTLVQLYYEDPELWVDQHGPYGSSCPAPNLNSPADGQTLSSRTVTFSWQAISGCSFNGYTFRIKDTNNMDSGGTTIVDTGESGTSRTETIPSQWDNRDLYWGVKAANASSASWAVWRFRIQPSGCNPNADQIALYVDGNYGGQCVVKGLGNYSDSNAIGLPDNSISSIQVGSDVKAVLYENANFGGLIETLHNDDPNLSDNIIGNDTLSSLRVEDDRPPIPQPPTLSAPADNSQFEHSDNITLQWNSSNGATNYRAEYDRTSGGAIQFRDISGLSWDLGSALLGIGAYRWQVNASNASGYSAWSGNWHFTVVPNRPVAVTASTISDSQVALSWTQPSGPFDGFRIYREGTPTALATVGASSTAYTVSGLTCGTQYTFIVTAYASSGYESPYSNGAVATTSACPPQVPPVPQQTAPVTGSTFEHQNSITLSWNSSQNATQYQIEYTHNGGTILVPAQTEITLPFSNGQLAVSDYAWRVRAGNAGGWSAWSGYWNFTVHPNQPTNLSAQPVTESQIALSWTNSGGDLDGFKIYVNGQSTPHATVNSNTSTYTYSGASCGTSYSFQVRAYKVNFSEYQSAPSNTATAATTCPSTQQINVKVRFQARNSANSRPHSVPIKLEIKGVSNNQTVFETNSWIPVSDDSSNDLGTATIDITAAGLTQGQTYRFYVRGAMHLDKLITAPYNDGMTLDLTDSVVNPDGVLWACDIDQNNIVDDQDATILQSHFGATYNGPPDPTSEIYRSDLDGSGTINTLDWAVCSSNIGKHGDSSPPQGAGPILLIPSDIPGIVAGTVTVPISFTHNGTNIASVIFSVDFDETCLIFDPTDGDGDGIPDTVTFNVPSAFNASITPDLTDIDGELDFFVADIFPPLASLLDGTIVTIDLTINPACQPAPGQTRIVPVNFSSDPIASFGNTSGQAVTGTTINGSVLISSTGRGDCNGDGRVDAGDVTACVLEIFDGDGSFWLNAGGGSFAGTPAGCDSNGDTSIDAGDIICTVLIIFGGPNACGSSTQAAQQADPAILAVTTESVTAADKTADVTVELATQGYQVAATTFSLHYDPQQLFLSAVDANGDDVPDSVVFHLDDDFAHSATIDNHTGTVEIFIADLTVPLVDLAAGQLVSFTFDTRQMLENQSSETLVLFSSDVPATLGSIDGASITVTTTDGMIYVLSVDESHPLYLPLVSND